MVSGANEQKAESLADIIFRGCHTGGTAVRIMMRPTTSRAVRLALSCALVASSHALAERPGALGEDAAALKPAEDTDANQRVLMVDGVGRTIDRLSLIHI